jgi:hypothetical protein
MGGACGIYGEEEKCTLFLLGNVREGRHSHIWEYNIKMNLHRAHIGFICFSIGTMNIQVS